MYLTIDMETTSLHHYIMKKEIEILIKKLKDEVSNLDNSLCEELSDKDCAYLYGLITSKREVIYDLQQIIKETR